MFVWNVSKIFGHGLLSFTLGVIRFCFSLGTVFGFIGMAVMGIKWLVLRQANSLFQVAFCLAVAFGCFVVNVAIATVQRNLRLALARSIERSYQPREADEPAPPAPPPASAPIARHGPYIAPPRDGRAKARAWR